MSKVTIAIPEDLSSALRLPPGKPKAGAARKTGRIRIWMLWYKNDRHVWHNGYGPAKATDFINRYKEDVALMKARRADALPHLDQLVTLFH